MIPAQRALVGELPRGIKSRSRQREMPVVQLVATVSESVAHSALNVYCDRHAA
jgi:hypothetical protein